MKHILSKMDEEQYQCARYISHEGWDGIPAVAFRMAMIRAARFLNSNKSTCAIKIGLFVVPDGFDRVSGQALVKITKGKPKPLESIVRHPITGRTFSRIRPCWLKWGAKVCIRYDSDLLSVSDVKKLLTIAGTHIGIMEGRPDSPACGMGWGTFIVKKDFRRSIA